MTIHRAHPEDPAAILLIRELSATHVGNDAAAYSEKRIGPDHHVSTTGRGRSG